MLPDSKFPISGGIMQTEEIGSDRLTTPLRHQNIQYQPPSATVNMAVKQEPQEDDDKSCDVNTLSPQMKVMNDSSKYFESILTLPTAHNYANSKSQPVADDSNNKSKMSRGRRKARWKLKFHHQALPAEYLDHYEAALAQESLSESPVTTSSTSASSSTSPSPISNVQTWLQRIALMQNELSYPQKRPPPPAPPPTTRPPMKYADLPYMGEITLDNSKPRRGRKPKKADICHLIYKNYGTIVPGTPGHPAPEDPAQMPTINVPAFNRSEIQNRISSLLEKRLTQEQKLSKEQEEPMNLCIRDMNHLKIQIPCNNSSSDDAEDSNDVIESNNNSIISNNDNSIEDPAFWPVLNSANSALTVTTEKPTTKRTSNPQVGPPTNKRKRSAIFIPPLPTENNNNPATEVSICKFKFTGGAKPSLQEKKSLSVDSGGNFRYYSGTGDKNTRGYEFFPREAIQQQQQQITQPGYAPDSPVGIDSCSGSSSYINGRKRKTKKTMQREKLEKTFKEKGFLIQTQQLESAEGATYCKFRQLRKFTRYLFRSWKDYLPGSVAEPGSIPREQILEPEDEEEFDGAKN